MPPTIHARAAGILTAAAALIAQPANWTTGAACRDANGIPTHPDYGDAVAYCAIGAVDQAGRLDRRRYPPPAGLGLLNAPTPMSIALGYLHSAVPPGCPDDAGVLWLNDAPGTTHQDILGLFRRAIDAANAAPDKDGEC